MSKDEKEYTEQEFNQALSDQKVNIRLDSLDKSFEKLTEEVREGMDSERKDYEKILKAIKDQGKEREIVEIRMRDDINGITKKNYEVFVKKSDLKLYATLIVIAITLTTGAITYVSKQVERSHYASKSK